MQTALEEHSINLLDNFICGYMINDLELCDEIIEFHKNSPMKYAGLVGAGLNPSIKKSTDLALNLDEPLYQRYSKNLQKCLDLYISKYKEAGDTVRFEDFENINIQHYQASEAYFGWHSERGGIDATNNRRHLVFMTYLNNVDDEGETEFLYQKIKIKPQKGLTLIWPVDWTFTHRGIPSRTQEKYITTGWYSFVK